MGWAKLQIVCFFWAGCMGAAPSSIFMRSFIKKSAPTYANPEAAEMGRGGLCTPSLLGPSFWISCLKKVTS